MPRRSKAKPGPAEEYIAHLAERGVQKPSWWKEFIQKIRMWWSNTRWGKEFHMTDSQIETLLARSSRKMRKRWYNKASRVNAVVQPGTEENGFVRNGTEGVRFAVNNKFNTELEEQISGRLPKGHIYQLGRPGGNPCRYRSP